MEAKDDIAVDPGTGQPFFGEAYLNFFDGQLRMQGMYEKGRKQVSGNIISRGQSTVIIILPFLMGILFQQTIMKMIEYGWVFQYNTLPTLLGPTENI